MTLHTNSVLGFVGASLIILAVALLSYGAATQGSGESIGGTVSHGTATNVLLACIMLIGTLWATSFIWYTPSPRLRRQVLWSAICMAVQACEAAALYAAVVPVAAIPTLRGLVLASCLSAALQCWPAFTIDRSPTAAGTVSSPPIPRWLPHICERRGLRNGIFTVVFAASVFTLAVPNIVAHALVSLHMSDAAAAVAAAVEAPGDSTFMLARAITMLPDSARERLVWARALAYSLGIIAMAAALAAVLTPAFLAVARGWHIAGAAPTTARVAAATSHRRFVAPLATTMAVQLAGAVVQVAGPTLAPTLRIARAIAVASTIIVTLLCPAALLVVSQAREEQARVVWRVDAYRGEFGSILLQTKRRMTRRLYHEVRCPINVMSLAIRDMREAGREPRWRASGGATRGHAPGHAAPAVGGAPVAAEAAPAPRAASPPTTTPAPAPVPLSLPSHRVAAPRLAPAVSSSGGETLQMLAGAASEMTLVLDALLTADALEAGTYAMRFRFQDLRLTLHTTLPSLIRAITDNTALRLNLQIADSTALLVPHPAVSAPAVVVGAACDVVTLTQLLRVLATQVCRGAHHHVTVAAQLADRPQAIDSAFAALPTLRHQPLLSGYESAATGPHSPQSPHAASNWGRGAGARVGSVASSPSATAPLRGSDGLSDSRPPLASDWVPSLSAPATAPSAGATAAAAASASPAMSSAAPRSGAEAAATGPWLASGARAHLHPDDEYSMPSPLAQSPAPQGGGGGDGGAALQAPFSSARLRAVTRDYHLPAAPVPPATSAMREPALFGAGAATPQPPTHPALPARSMRGVGPRSAGGARTQTGTPSNMTMGTGSGGSTPHLGLPSLGGVAGGTPFAVGVVPSPVAAPASVDRYGVAPHAAAARMAAAAAAGDTTTAITSGARSYPSGSRSHVSGGDGGATSQPRSLPPSIPRQPAASSWRRMCCRHPCDAFSPPPDPLEQASAPMSLPFVVQRDAEESPPVRNGGGRRSGRHRSVVLPSAAVPLVVPAPDSPAVLAQRATVTLPEGAIVTARVVWLSVWWACDGDGAAPPAPDTPPVPGRATMDGIVDLPGLTGGAGLSLLLRVASELARWHGGAVFSNGNSTRYQLMVPLRVIELPQGSSSTSGGTASVAGSNLHLAAPRGLHLPSGDRAIDVTAQAPLAEARRRRSSSPAPEEATAHITVTATVWQRTGSGSTNVRGDAAPMPAPADSSNLRIRVRRPSQPVPPAPAMVATAAAAAAAATYSPIIGSRAASAGSRRTLGSMGVAAARGAPHHAPVTPFADVSSGGSPAAVADDRLAPAHLAAPPSPPGPGAMLDALPGAVLPLGDDVLAGTAHAPRAASRRAMAAAAWTAGGSSGQASSGTVVRLAPTRESDHDASIPRSSSSTRPSRLHGAVGAALTASATGAPGGGDDDLALDAAHAESPHLVPASAALPPLPTRRAVLTIRGAGASAQRGEAAAAGPPALHSPPLLLAHDGSASVSPTNTPSLGPTITTPPPLSDAFSGATRDWGGSNVAAATPSSLLAQRRMRVVLVVDDVSSNRTLLIRNLRRRLPSGTVFLQAGDGATAVDVVRRCLSGLPIPRALDTRWHRGVDSLSGSAESGPPRASRGSSPGWPTPGDSATAGDAHDSPDGSPAAPSASSAVPLRPDDSDAAGAGAIAAAIVTGSSSSHLDYGVGGGGASGTSLERLRGAASVPGSAPTHSVMAAQSLRSGLMSTVVTATSSRPLGAWSHSIDGGSGGGDGGVVVPPPDFICLDHDMPVMTGGEAARRMRAGGYRGAIIGITGNALPADLAAFKACGCDDVLSKPIDVGHLMHVITTLWRRGGGSVGSGAVGSSVADDAYESESGGEGGDGGGDGSAAVATGDAVLFHA